MPEIKFLARLKETPTVKTQILRLAPPSVNEKMLHDFSNRLGLQGTRQRGILRQDADSLTYTEGTNMIQMFRASGGIRFADQARWQIDDSKSEVKITDNDAISMAQKKIQQIELVPLKECRVSKVTRLRAGSLEKASGKFEERVIDTGVVFQRMIDKVPVDGPGGMVVIYLDHNGDMTGFDCIWRKVLEVYKPVDKLQTPQFAETKLSTFYKDFKIDRIDVKETRFGYFEMGWTYAQQYLQPAYIMPVTLFAQREGTMIMKSAFVLEAAVTPVGTLMPKRKVIKAQPPRQG